MHDFIARRSKTREATARMRRSVQSDVQPGQAQFKDNRPEAQTLERLKAVADRDSQLEGSKHPKFMPGGLAKRSVRVRTTEVPPSETTSATHRFSTSAQDVAALKKIGVHNVAPAVGPSGLDPRVVIGTAYGLTWPQDLAITLGAKHMGDEWVANVTDLEGEYSTQARLLNHQFDIRNAEVATDTNFQQLINSLQALGVPGDSYNAYSLRAVEAHESRHATRTLPALASKRDGIEKRIERLTIPDSGVGDEGAAVGAIEALPGYANAVKDSYGLWFKEMIRLIQDDHAPDGPCEVAEKSITEPLIKAIREKAVAENWIGTPEQVEVGPKSRTVEEARTTITTAPRSVRSEAPKIPERSTSFEDVKRRFQKRSDQSGLSASD